MVMKILTLIIVIMSKKKITTLKCLPHPDTWPARQPNTDHQIHIFHVSQKQVSACCKHSTPQLDLKSLKCCVSCVFKQYFCNVCFSILDCQIVYSVFKNHQGGHQALPVGWLSGLTPSCHVVSDPVISESTFLLLFKYRDTTKFFSHQHNDYYMESVALCSRLTV